MQIIYHLMTVTGYRYSNDCRTSYIIDMHPSNICHVASSAIYRLAQNSGGVKLWRIDHFRVLARKTLANLQLYISHFSESGIWMGKILANDVPFAKFAEVFPARILRYTVAIARVACACKYMSSCMLANEYIQL